MVKSGKNKFRTLTTLVTAVAVLSVLLVSACQSRASTQNVEGIVQAVDGQDVLITLPDGSRVRVSAENQADDARTLVGSKVEAEIETGDDNPKLVNIEKSEVQTASDLTGQGTPEDFHFVGAIESISADMFVVGGKTFKINAATILDDGLAVGVEAEVEFVMLADGSLLATEIEMPAADSILFSQSGQEAGEDFSLTGVIGTMSATEIVLGGKIFKIDANTFLDNGLAVGAVARVEFVVQPDGSLLALDIETDAPDSIIPGDPGEAGEDFTSSGSIQSISGNSVMIDGRTFTIDAGTILDTGLAPGVLAEVEFVVQPDGSLAAKAVETAGIDEGVNFYFAGAIQSMSPAAWVIGGKTFTITETTMLDEGLAVGVNVNVEFVITADGAFQAVHIEDSGFEFTGLVQAITPNAYTIGGRIFKVNANTLIDQGLKVRKMAEVNFLIEPDGSLLALKIKSAKTKVQGFIFKGVVQSLSATAITVTGQTFRIVPTTTIGAGVAAGVEVNVVFDIAPGNVLTAISVQNAGTVQKKK